MTTIIYNFDSKDFIKEVEELAYWIEEDFWSWESAEPYGKKWLNLLNGKFQLRQFFYTNKKINEDILNKYKNKNIEIIQE